MNPQGIFCPNIDCPARGQCGQGNISIHDRREKRYRCSACQGTFVTTTGTLFYRLRSDPQIVLCVITLLASPIIAGSSPNSSPSRCYRRVGPHLLSGESLPTRHFA